MFSERELPSSERIASIRRSRSAMSPSRVVMYSFRLTLKFRALILFRSWRFSLLLIFLYSSGLGRQSSGSRILSGSRSFEDFDFPAPEFESFSEGAYDFFTPPETTAPRRERLGGASSGSGSWSEFESWSEWSFEVAGVPTSCGSIANMGVLGSMLSGLEPLALALPPKKSYEGTESEGSEGPFVNSSVSKNWAKKSSSAPFEKVKGLRGDEDEDEAVKAEGAEFSMSRLKKSSTVENGGEVVIESVNILVDVVE